MKGKLSAQGGRGVLLFMAAVAMGLAGCAQPRVAEVYPQVAEFDGREIVELSFLNTDPFSPDSLDALTETHETYCRLVFLPFCFPGTDWGERVGRVNMRRVGADLARLSALYRQAGYFGTAVVPQIEEADEAGGPVLMRFVVNRGDGIVMDSVVVEGTEGIVDPDSLESTLPLQPGELFDLREFSASADTVSGALRARGHAYAEVLRNYAVDTIQDRATAWLLAIPGPRVVVDSVLVDGLEELGRRDVLRQLPFDVGDLLRLRDLRAGQRNLYDLNLVRFASVAVAADSLQLTPEDSTTATIRIALTEAPEHVVETRVGWGSVDCFGVRGQWTDRSVFGGGRQLTVTGSLNRVGLGDPVSGLENSICSSGADREFATELDYRLAADFTQPYFISSRNQLTTTAYSEREAEPGLFQRTATGARFGLNRRLSSREYLSTALEAEYRQTRGSAVLYCFEFRACSQEDVDRLTGARWRNALSATWLRDRGNSAVNPTSGHVLRSRGVWSTGLLASDYDFLRVTAEASVYRSPTPGWVLAAFGRVGTFLTRATLGPRDFIPPEERFFAGGATSVRGLDRATLGPGLYLADRSQGAEPIVPSDTLRVEYFPTGGTSTSVASLEARFPSPILGDLLRMVAFVDAGTVGLDPLWELDSQWRVTPGMGIRVATPVGPIRVDLGYNPYPPPRAALVAVDSATRELVRVSDSFRPPSGAWYDRFSLHIAVGQAF